MFPVLAFLADSILRVGLQFRQIRTYDSPTSVCTTDLASDCSCRVRVRKRGQKKTFEQAIKNNNNEVASVVSAKCVWGFSAQQKKKKKRAKRSQSSREANIKTRADVKQVRANEYLTPQAREERTKNTVSPPLLLFAVHVVAPRGVRSYFYLLWCVTDLSLWEKNPAAQRTHRTYAAFFFECGRRASLIGTQGAHTDYSSTLGALPFFQIVLLPFLAAHRA